MSIIFDPRAYAQRVLSKNKIKRMISDRFSVKRAVLATVESDDLGLDKKSILSVAIKTLRSYRQRLSKLEQDKDQIADQIKRDPKLLIQRVQNEVIFQIHDGIKTKYRGQKARWLPSDAEEPRPEHQKYYGKVYTIGEGIDGLEPGDEYGCKCGVEILTDDESLDLT